jgi:hypothetical protein
MDMCNQLLTSTSAEYYTTGNKSPVTKLIHEPIGLITLITSWLTSNLYYLQFSAQWTSVDVINIPTGRRTNSPPNSNHEGVYTR